MKEAFNVGFDLAPDDPELLAGKPFRALNAWPELPGFRETLLAYYDACAGSGSAHPPRFRARPRRRGPTISPTSSTGRWRRCASCAIRPGSAARRIGAGVHTDYGNLTLLATDDVGGLEVRTRVGRLDRGAGHAGRLCRQHRRLPDALDERRLRLHSAPRRQPQRRASAIPSPSSSTPIRRPKSRPSPPACPRASAPATRRSWRPTI